MYRYSGRQLREKADRSLAKALRQPERRAQEAAFAEKHQNDTDEELYEYIKAQKRKYGHRLKRMHTVGYSYLVERLGPWDDFMRRITSELAGEMERNEPTEST